MRLDKVKKLAAQVLHSAKNKVWLNPEEAEKIGAVMTKDDVRGLVKEGIIKKKMTNSQSRGAARILAMKKKKGRKSGRGKRRGSKKTRKEKKRQWVKNVRSQRKKLKELAKKNPKEVMNAGYGKTYRMIKGSYFKGKTYVEAYIKEKGGK